LILLSSICWKSSLWPRKGKFVSHIKLHMKRQIDQTLNSQVTICLRFVDKNLNIRELNMKKIIDSFARKHPRRMMST
jgi:hypothetical protein